MEENKKFQDLIEKIESLSVLELNKLVKLLEEKFGISAAAMMASGPVQTGATPVEEKDSFAIHLKSGGETKIQVIKIVKEALNLGLKEAKDLVDAAPSLLKEGVKKEDAEKLKKDIEAAGGQVELK